MDINRLETHDRLLHFKSDWEGISKAVQECIDNVPDSINFPFYVYGHSRQIGLDERFSIFFNGYYRNMEDVPNERLIWMPRAYRPSAEPNTYLFRAKKGTDLVETIWILPKQELWEQFEPGKMTHNEDIWTCIQNYKHHKRDMEHCDGDDLTLQQINEFKYFIKEAAKEKRKDATVKNLYSKINISDSFIKIF